MSRDRTETEEARSASPLRSVLRCALLFVLLAALLTGALTAVARIPRDALRRNLLESAEYLCEGELFGMAAPEVNGSRIDRYADSILLGIAWQYDETQSLRSVMRSAYYHDPQQNENRNLLRAVTEDLPANQQYLRYWHGSLLFVRPLLTVLTLRQIYVLHGVLLGAAALGLPILLLRRREYACALGLVLGMVATAFFFVPLSLEYYWVCLLCLLLSAAAVGLARREELHAPLFLAGGMLTAFLDFLTAETLTLLIPLLLLLWLRRDRDPARTALRSILAWAAGYVGMWALKWGLAALVLQENILPDLSAHMEERIGKDFYRVGQARLFLGALTRNLGCLFPLGWGTAGAVAAALLAGGALYCGFVYRRPGWDRARVLTWAALGLLPYLRYLALRSHAYLHCFFTYRAQMATLLAATLILAELTARRRGKQPADPSAVFIDRKRIQKKGR